MDAIWLSILFRIIHLTGAACIVLGFLALPLLADLVIRPLGSDRAEEILRTIRRRATVLAWIGVVMQFVSGTWSWITLSRHYERVGIWADVTLATKMLLAGVIAVILFMQVDSQPVEKPRIGWLLARIGLVALLVVLASTLRQWRIAA